MSTAYLGAKPDGIVLENNGTRSLTDHYSIEISEREVESFQGNCRSLLPGSEVAITAMPGDNLGARVQTALAIRRASLSPVPHLAARQIASLADLREFTTRLISEAHVDRFFVIGGDVNRPLGPFADALSVLTSGAFSLPDIKRIGIAGYPDGHPTIPDEKLWEALTSKINALTALKIPWEIVTQFSFDSDATLVWLERLRDKGLLAPVKIGIPGPSDVKTLLRLATVCGVRASARLAAKYGFSQARLLTPTSPANLIASLELNYRPDIHGDVSIHFYPLGGIQQTARWIENLRRSSPAICDRVR